MSDIAIRVENLGKRYRIGGAQTHYKTLRESLVSAASAPVRWLKGQRHERNTFWALQDVSFEIKQGEAMGVIGRNGAGKSTLLKILSRITKPTTGRVDLYGRVGSLLEVGTGFSPELTGRDNIFLNGAILGMNHQEIIRKFDEIVAFAEVDKFLDTPVKYYSSGMYVRLAFAVAAHLEPEILVVDEVLAVGDAEFQKKCLGKMGDVAHEGRTVLFVSHNMLAIQTLCQRVLLLQGGTVKMDGDPSTVISSYLSKGYNVNSAEVDLRNHPGRSYSKEPTLRKTWITNGNGITNNIIEMGGNLTLNYQFQCNREIKFPGFGFVIEDERGGAVFALNNRTVPSEQNTFKAIFSGIVCFHIPHLPLMPGTYHVNLALTADNDNEWIDYVERAISLHVQPRDVYGSGVISHQSLGSVFVSGEINVTPIEISQSVP